MTSARCATRAIATTMQARVPRSPGDLSGVEKPVRQPGKAEALVRRGATAVCEAVRIEDGMKIAVKTPSPGGGAE